jgi:hypothetical protein
MDIHGCAWIPIYGYYAGTSMNINGDPWQWISMDIHGLSVDLHNPFRNKMARRMS